MSAGPAILVILALAVGVRLARARRSWTDVLGAAANLKDRSAMRRKEIAGAFWTTAVLLVALWALVR